MVPEFGDNFELVYDAAGGAGVPMSDSLLRGWAIEAMAKKTAEADKHKGATDD